MLYVSPLLRFFSVHVMVTFLFDIVRTGELYCLSLECGKKASTSMSCAVDKLQSAYPIHYSWRKGSYLFVPMQKIKEAIVYSEIMALALKYL